MTDTRKPTLPELADWFGLDEAQVHNVVFGGYAARTTRELVLRCMAIARQKHEPAALAQAITTAEGFRVAIDALPVGKDIRRRLNTHLDAHIAALRSIRSPGGA